MRSFFDAMQAATLECIRSWPRDQPLPMLPEMKKITLRVILQAVLGLPPGPELSQEAALVAHDGLAADPDSVTVAPPQS